ncbi:MAG: AraC family transcriptional regulator [Pseudomonadota bacterium]
MLFSYHEPAARLKGLVGSYYFVTMPFEISDIMRAEIANARFVLSGSISSDLLGDMQPFSPPSALLCGPTQRWSHIHFSPGARVFGAAITPLGWGRLFGFSAENAADKILSLRETVPQSAAGDIDAIFEKSDERDIVAIADRLFSSLISDKWRVREEFIQQATDWIVDPEPNEIEHLLAGVDLSHRQIDRLCRAYFGTSPKKLHRKFRALHAANRLTWMDLTDWRDIARTAYYDQAHFIREFKQFNGRTPKEFVDGPHILVRTTLAERLKINHESPFSLVG